MSQNDMAHVCKYQEELLTCRLNSSAWKFRVPSISLTSSIRLCEKSPTVNFTVPPSISIMLWPGSFFTPLPFNIFLASATSFHLPFKAYKFDKRTYGELTVGWSSSSLFATLSPTTTFLCRRHEESKLPQMIKSFPKQNISMYRSATSNLPALPNISTKQDRCSSCGDIPYVSFIESK